MKQYNKHTKKLEQSLSLGKTHARQVSKRAEVLKSHATSGDIKIGRQPLVRQALQIFAIVNPQVFKRAEVLKAHAIQVSKPWKTSDQERSERCGQLLFEQALELFTIPKDQAFKRDELLKYSLPILFYCVVLEILAFPNFQLFKGDEASKEAVTDVFKAWKVKLLYGLALITPGTWRQSRLLQQNPLGQLRSTQPLLRSRRSLPEQSSQHLSRSQLLLLHSGCHEIASKHEQKPKATSLSQRLNDLKQVLGRIEDDSAAEQSPGRGATLSQLCSLKD
ncbi:hypothetical protein L484_000977 [Morus notabilis]|uniref:Uncharacterized protein n=1 Tax=Morus notabilis TaxID=981085 RepID=W9RIM0_9ROSA|nr:hypothetical protein L484_000977 [Morus notabilis]